MMTRIIALALPLGLSAAGLALVVVLGAWMRVVPPLPALGLFALTLAGGGGLSLLLGIVGVVKGGDGRSASLAAALIGLACIGILATLVLGSRGAPPIHDISTNTDDPPAFIAAAANPANRDRDLSYPNGSPESAAMQRSAYPDVVPLEFAASPAEVFEQAVAVATELGWTITTRDAAGGTFEAEDQTAVFGFIDDIVVRVRPAAAGAVVDVRSLSREGVSDLGANAARIRRFGEAVGAARR